MTATYTLPDLPYPDDALDPWCPAETLHLHHDKHHASYVKEANRLADELAAADPSNTVDLAGLTAAFTFNVAGHVLHSLFWTSIGPEAGGPAGPIEKAVSGHFGDLDRFNSVLTAACMGVRGSGWGALFADPFNGALRIGAVHDHQGDVVGSSSLLAVIDVWEHAYYLTHRNDRAAWVKAAVGHLDWASIGRRYEEATRPSGSREEPTVAIAR